MTNSEIGSLRDRLRDVSRHLNSLQNAKSARERRVLAIVLFMLTVCAASVSGVAQFLALQDGDSIGPWNVAGIVAAALIFLGGIVALVSQWNKDDELAAAQRAASLSMLYDDVARDFPYFFRQLDRASELFRAMQLMRTLVQLLHELNVKDEDERVRLLMEVVDPTLLLAFDFEFGEHWTLAVYKAEPDPACCELLRCVATKRAIKQGRRAPRKWPTGVGFAGIVHARGSELVLADLADKALGNFDELPSNLVRDSDRQHYRSVAAVPILVRGTGWGVAVATSDRPGRFDMDDDGGVRSAEAVRALAGMVALAVSTAHNPPPSSAPPLSPPPVPRTGAPSSGKAQGKPKARRSIATAS